MVKFIGVDPGHTGAIVVLDPATLAFHALPMPLIDIGVTKKSWVPCARTLAKFLRDAGVTAADQATVENVFSSPESGVVGAFTFGMAKGVPVGVLGALGVEITYVSPAHWKNQMGAPANKLETIGIAHKWFPQCVGAIGDHDGIAEAALIALYAVVASGTPLTGPFVNFRKGGSGHPRQPR